MIEVVVPMQTLHQIPLFNEMTQNELTELESRLIRRRQLRKKAIVFTEGSEQKALFFIRSGLIKAYRTNEQGQEHMISYYKAGDMLPPDGFDTPVYSVTAECIVQTTLFVLPVVPFEHYLRSHPNIAAKIMRVMSDLMDECKRKQQQQKKQGLEHYGQMFLLKLAEHCGSTRHGELRIGIPMTRQYLANTIGSTQEKATLFVNQLSKEGIVDMTRNGFVIHDVESLKRWKEN
jgi:CRP/FNR family cyclic AMP-dependent transcriptional regulator